MKSRIQSPQRVDEIGPNRALLESCLNEMPLEASVKAGVLKFYEVFLQENQIQNLSRLTSPREFIDYHLVDSIQLLKTGWVLYPALDLGSGGGIPGLLAAILDRESWILVESEKRKAEFLRRAVNTLQIHERVRVVHDRAENTLKTQKVGSIVVRAVGTLEKIYGWIRKCSTWNNLILLKGPKWEEEWAQFAKTSVGTQLKVAGEVDYHVGPEQKLRKIIRLERIRS